MAESVVLISGGVDSAVTFAEAAREDDEPPVAVHASYGQHTASKERDCAEALASHYGAEYVEVDLSDAFAAFEGGLTGDDDLSTHYDDDGVATSYVPMRNTVLLASPRGSPRNSARRPSGTDPTPTTGTDTPTAATSTPTRWNVP